MHAPDEDLEFKEFIEGNAAGGGTLLFGRTTYEKMASFWPTPAAAEQMPMVAKQMNGLSKVVFSRTLKKASWQNTTAGGPDRRVPAGGDPRRPGQRKDDLRRREEAARPRSEEDAVVPERKGLARLQEGVRSKPMGGGEFRKGQLIIEGETATLIFRRILAHPPEQVWEAIATPEGLKEWLLCSEARIEGRTGGTFE